LPSLRALVEGFITAPLESMDLERLRPGLRHPGLLMHDPADAEVPYADSEALLEYWPQAKLQARPGAGHTRILRDLRAIAGTIDFLTR
ncbi:hypothetical protein ABTE09_19500, partial [Acinetobacter baumannii]